jgi:hypothetical protein
MTFTLMAAGTEPVRLGRCVTSTGEDDGAQ